MPQSVTEVIEVEPVSQVLGVHTPQALSPEYPFVVKFQPSGFVPSPQLFTLVLDVEPCVQVFFSHLPQT